MRSILFTAMTAALAAGIGVSAPAADQQAMIDEATSAAPDEIAQTATIKTMQGETLREGTGAFTCLPGIPGGPGPMCVDEEWGRLVSALMKKEDYTPQQVGVAYMLAGDMPDGGASNTDPFATGKTDENQWVVEGPHLMIVVPDAASLEAFPTDPENGGPYVMWKGTPYAHIMVPTTGK
jgi:hypothetical protein